ncbi:DUF5979 domain-containing protein [Corynebacterium felinum]|uniref:LPXTG-motif cell wall-anchored protein n=1 Tax=Corynebacterium felinum TaxID=131318 RepID=A0ABU2B717_9CORY|nr:DUF5979 domain-containing protein [Corynebacterium felinum]MDF5820776.1 DUF5979 domain-containing protein [Corynebacterium felinum]MDR7353819.1 LPXTG-motif cell wall-anchored protein [Corynebacterium felinum]WJY95996.1 T surface-antigen of pili [Corynebacterium felinum]
MNPLRSVLRKGLTVLVATTLLGTSVAVAPQVFAQGVDRTDEYGTSLEVIGGNPPANLSETQHLGKPLMAGETFRLKFNWSANGKTKPKKGDVLAVQLPAWMDPPLGSFSADRFTDCQVTPTKLLTCELTQLAEDANEGTVGGYFGFDVKALAAEVSNEDKDKIKFGGQTIHAYQYLTGDNAGTIGKKEAPTELSHEKIAAKTVKAGKPKHLGYRVVNGEKFALLRWDINTTVIDDSAGGRLEITDALEPVTITDPDTGKEIKIPQYVAPASAAVLQVVRRDAESVNSGTWSTRDDKLCAATGYGDKAQKVKCAEVVARTDKASTSLILTPGVRETVDIEGFDMGPTAFTKSTTAKITVNNVETGSAYRIAFYTLVPTDNLPENKGTVANPKARNTAEVNGMPYSSGDVEVHTDVFGASWGDLDSQKIVVKKQIDKPAGAEEPDKTEFTVTATQEGKTFENCTISEATQCEFIVAKDKPFVLTESPVTGSKFAWESTFEQPASQTDKKTPTPTFEPGKATLIPAGGEVYTLILKNSYKSAASKLKVNKKVALAEGADPAQAAELDKSAADANFSFTYSCTAPGKDAVSNDEGQPLSVTVANAGETKAIPEGATCEFTEVGNTVAGFAHEKMTVAVGDPSKGLTATVKEGSTNTFTVTGVPQSDEPLELTVTNTYSKDAGAFTLSKKFEGIDAKDAKLVAKTFNFTYTCGDALKDEPLAIVAKDGQWQSATSKPVPTGQECVIKETAPEEVEGWVWLGSKGADGAVAKDTTITVPAAKKGEVAQVVSTNVYERAKTTFTVAKKLEGEAKDDPKVTAAKFGFTYTCTVDGKAVEIAEPNFEITGAAEWTSPEVPVGAECVVEETKAEIPGFTWAEKPAAGAKVTKSINELAVADNKVEFTNTYTRDTGTFTLTKNFEGIDAKDAKLVAKTFNFTYTCGDALKDEKLVIEAKDGVWASATSKPVPTGQECTITEAAPEEIEGWVWLGSKGADGAVAKDTTITVPAGTKDQVQAVTATNVYERAKTTFTVAKKLEGDAKDHAKVTAAKFGFTYTCTVDGKAVEIDKPNFEITGASEWTSPEIPVGAECVVEETKAEIPGFIWAEKPAAGAKVTKTINELAVADNKVEFTNTYALDARSVKISKKVAVAQPEPAQADNEFVAEAAEVAKDKDFNFRVVCTSALVEENKVDKEFTLKDGATETIENVPADAVCVITENDPAVKDASLTVSAATGEVDKLGESTVVAEVEKTEAATNVEVVKDLRFGKNNAEVAVTNAYAAHTGTLTVAKQLEGTAAKHPVAQNAQFDVTVICAQDGTEYLNKDVKVSAKKNFVFKGIRPHSECTVAEKLDDAAIAELEKQGLRVNKEASAKVSEIPAVTKDQPNAVVTVTNTIDELGKISVTKVLAGLTGENQGKDREFTITATWKEGEGDAAVEKTQELKVRAGETNIELPALPVGTEVTLVETMPEDSALAAWKTPEYFGEKVTDSGANKAVVVVTPDTFGEALAVTVRNTANPPAWWLLIGLVPVLGTLVAAFAPKMPPAPATPVAPQAPQGAGQVAPQAPQGAGQVAPQAPSKGIAKQPTQAPSKGIAKGEQATPATQAKSQRQLAQTGASVLAVLLIGLILAVLGVFLIRRKNS